MKFLNNGFSVVLFALSIVSQSVRAEDFAAGAVNVDNYENDTSFFSAMHGAYIYCIDNLHALGGSSNTDCDFQAVNSSTGTVYGFRELTAQGTGRSTAVISYFPADGSYGTISLYGHNGDFELDLLGCGRFSCPSGD